MTIKQRFVNHVYALQSRCEINLIMSKCETHQEKTEHHKRLREGRATRPFWGQKWNWRRRKLAQEPEVNVKWEDLRKKRDKTRAAEYQPRILKVEHRRRDQGNRGGARGRKWKREAVTQGSDEGEAYHQTHATFMPGRFVKRRRKSREMRVEEWKNWKELKERKWTRLEMRAIFP